MDKLHRDIVHKAVKHAAAQIDGRLPAHPSHPNGRIPTAHIYQVIQTVMQTPARCCDNNRVDDILSIIEDCVDFVSVSDVSSTIKDKYQPQCIIKPASLESFF